MQPETIFKICNNAAPLGWLLMAFAPRWNGSKTRALRALPLASGTGVSNVLLAALVLIKFSKENAAQGVLLFSLVYLEICSWLTK